ncbi:MAG: protein-L-isoaspartate(D-aspartate) O-methyltransferase [Anaerolineaceae bacterium]|nr:protein-L-isoaspartate(D-aspartate) O-methyltransferase [Anaerolineaceae bacterium]
MDEFAAAREQMVAWQIEKRGITNHAVLNAMRSVPRHLFIPPEYVAEAYADCPLPIGYGQTISQPYIVALMTQLLQLTGKENVLEIGTGCGYQAAVLSLLAHEVHSVEIIAPLTAETQKRLDRLGYNNVSVHLGDGSLGWQPNAPYDAIMVTAHAPKAPPALLEQLKPSGRLVLPVGSRNRQWLQYWRCENGVWQEESLIPVAFVPLRGEHGWQNEEE